MGERIAVTDTSAKRPQSPAGVQHDAAAGAVVQRADTPPHRPSARDLLSAAGGAPLPTAVRQQMERAFGAGFGRVRIHHGDEAEAYDAAAFTAGERIFMPRKAPRLDSGEGRSLLAHELTHVLQQRHGQVRRPADGVAVDPHPELERQAVKTAASVMRGDGAPGWGGSATAAPSPPSSGAAVQRAPKKDRRRTDEEEGIEMMPLRRPEPAAAEHDQAPVETRPRANAIIEPPEQEPPKPEPAQPKTEAPKKPAPGKEEPIPDDAIEKSRKRHKFVTNHLDAGQGGAGPALSQTDDGLRQAMAQMGDLAKQLEAAGRAGPMAPAPTVPWAQQQQAPGGDPSSPPPLPIPDLPQPDPGPTITPDAPMSPLTANAPTYRSFKEMHQEEEQAKEALRERHEKHKAEAAAASSAQGAPA